MLQNKSVRYLISPWLQPHSPEIFGSPTDASAAANTFRRIVGPFSAADVAAPPGPSGALSRVVDLTVAADKGLRVVGLVAATHGLAVVLDTEISVAADEALRVVGLLAAAGRHPGVLEAGLEVVGAADPLGPIVSAEGSRLAEHAFVLHEIGGCKKAKGGSGCVGIGEEISFWPALRHLSHYDLCEDASKL